MPSLKATERHQTILSQLQQDGRIEIDALVHKLGVSAVTVRQDLAHLEQSQLLRRIRGGAIAVYPSRFERPVDINASLQASEKTAIATVAAEMINDRETVIMSSGSTVEALARQLPLALRDIVVATNSLNVANLLDGHPGVTIIVTGGTLRTGVYSLAAPLGDILLSHVNADIAFLGCAGVDPQKGFTNSNWQDADVAKTMMRSAKRAMFLADHSKLKHIASAHIAGLSEADTLVTDGKAPQDTVKLLRQSGLNVITA